MFEIRYEDEFLLAVDKSSGIDTAPLAGQEGGESLLSQVIERFPGVAALPGRKDCEPGLLHRLDRGTSGLVLIAKTEAAFRSLLAAQVEGRIVKAYQALCAPSEAILPGAKPARGEISEGRIRSRFRTFGPKGARVAPLGEDFGTEGRLYETLVYGRSESRGIHGFEVSLARGFRHQVRAHLAWIGFPILGDELYAPGGIQAVPRLMLHAFSLAFPHPRDGRAVRIDCPAPRDFMAP